MNSTFPYIAPIITMPGEPQFQIMDAGIRDNYGTSTSLKFLYVFQDWIKENTSGVIFLQITEEKAKVCKSKPVDIFQFTWLIKKSYSGIKNRIYNQVKKDILLNIHNKKSEEDGPFPGFKEDK